MESVLPNGVSTVLGSSDGCIQKVVFHKTNPVTSQCLGLPILPWCLPLTHTRPPLLLLYFWTFRTLPNILIKVSKLRCYIAANKKRGQSLHTLKETSIGSPSSYCVSHWYPKPSTRPRVCFSVPAHCLA